MDTTNRIVLTRETEEQLIEDLIKQIKTSGKRYKKIKVTGRGGLSIAQRVAYALDIKVVTTSGKVNNSVLFIDEISCSGETLSKVDCDTATLVCRYSSKVKPTYYSMWVSDNRYIQFSWEKNK